MIITSIVDLAREYGRLDADAAGTGYFLKPGAEVLIGTWRQEAARPA